MSGVAVVRYLLANNAPLIAVVPAARIVPGELPQGSIFPAISVTLISGIPRTTIAMSEPNRLHSDRVQVSYLCKGPRGTVQGLGYDGIRAIAPLVLAACPNQRGSIDGVLVDSIICDIEGPDLADIAIPLFQGSRDFIVRWRSAT